MQTVEVNESSQTFEFSNATRADLPAVHELLHDCELPTQGVEAVERFVIAREGGDLVGCAGLELYGDFGLLRSVAVRSTTRGSGLGSELVRRIAAVAREQPLRELFLLTTTAVQFFARRGFELAPRSTVPPEIASSWEFRTGCPDSAIVMRRPLNWP